MAYTNAYVPALDAGSLAGSLQDADALLSGTGRFIRVHHVIDVYKPPLSLVGAVEVAAIANAQREGARKLEADVRQAFKAVAGDVTSGCEVALTVEEGEMPRASALAARTSDITVFRHRGEGRVAFDPSFFEALLFHSGRPLFLTPETGAGSDLNHVAIGWNGSRESARALAAAGPALQTAKSVSVITIGDERKDRPTADELVGQLQRCDISAKLVRRDDKGGSTTTILSQACEDNGCGLLVLGAFSQSRVREVVLGGVTRKMLREPPLPLLIAH
ncbi:MAG: universal stress protein [Pseudomonadota bacterium]